MVRIDDISKLSPAMQAQVKAQIGSARRDRAGFVHETSPIEELMWALMAQAGVDRSFVERQAEIIPGRDFRMDFVYRPARIVIECEGVTKGAKNSGHQTIEGVGKDALKGNLAQLEGWLFLRFTGRQIRKEADYVIETIRRAIALRSA